MKHATRGSHPSRALLLLLAVSALAGCRAPVALAAVVPFEFDGIVRALPPGGERVELRLDGETALRGVFVPPAEGAPLVLHLQESGGSVARGLGGRGRILRQLADLGMGSLMLDWSGVGVSSGTRANAHLRRDASAMWREAVRRVDGDASRVLLRGTSLGSLAAADLLRRGARPGAVVLVTPVLAETAHTNFARHAYGRFVGGVATAGMGGLVDVDLVAVVETCEVPLLLLQAADPDLFVTDEERDRIRLASPSATTRSGSIPGDHIEASLRARNLLPQELAFLDPLLPPLGDAEARAELLQSRLAEAASSTSLPNDVVTRRLVRIAPLLRTQPAERLLAAGLASDRPRNGARLLWLLERPDGALPPGYDGLEPPELTQVLSLDDPAGELPVDLVADLRIPYLLLSELGGMVGRLSPEHLTGIAACAGSGRLGGSWEAGVDMPWVGSQGFAFQHDRLWRGLVDRGLAPGDARRQMLRILLLVYGHAHRLGATPDGDPRVEVRVDDAWAVLDPDDPVDPAGPRFTYEVMLAPPR